MKRPLGYSLLAVFLGLSGLGSLFGATAWPSSMALFHVVIGPTFYALMIAGAVVSLGAARSLWLYERRAPEWFVAWALAGLATSAYSAVVIMPQMMKAMAALMGADTAPFEFPPIALVAQLVFVLVVDGVIYWYLTSRRRRVDAAPSYDASLLS